MMKRKQEGNQIILVNIRNEGIDKSRECIVNEMVCLYSLLESPNLYTDELI